MNRQGADDSAPRAGEILAGRYYVERVIGTGGMGCVVAATHVHLDERVAVKLLHPHLISEPETVQRFLREGRTAGRIQSPHVVRIKDVGELEDGRPYIVMEYLDGEDLSAVQKQRGMLPPQQAADYVLAAADALAEAHVMKTLHRDLKPSNIFLARLPNGGQIIKVLDFGIAKAFGAESAGHLTATAVVMGTPAFMAPEQLRKAQTLDHRVDIWALGVLLHKLTTNTLPFEGDTFAELSAAILKTEPIPLRKGFPHLPKEMEAVVATCLRKNPNDRFFDLADFALALAPLGTPASRPNVERILRTLGSPSQRAIVTAPNENPATTTAAGVTAMNTRSFEAPRKASTGLIVFALAASTLALVGLVAGTLALRARATATTGGDLKPTPVSMDSSDLVPSAEPRVIAPPPTGDPNPSPAVSSGSTSVAPSAKVTGRNPPPGKPTPQATKPTGVATTTPPPTTAATVAPTTPAGIATSSKD